MMVVDGKIKVIGWLEIISGLGTLAFWLLFFTVGLAPKEPPPCYFAYEFSFPVADVIMSAVLITAGILLIKGYVRGIAYSLAGAGAFVFLGILDISFNLRNGIYSSGYLDLLLNAFINIWCVVFGIIIVIVMSKKLVGIGGGKE